VAFQTNSLALKFLAAILAFLWLVMLIVNQLCPAYHTIVLLFLHAFSVHPKMIPDYSAVSVMV
jgi:hypothetical protein